LAVAPGASLELDGDSTLHRYSAKAHGMEVDVGLDPVFAENGVGSYAATDLPDQATVLATAGVPTGNTVARQNVFEARLMLQTQF
jgi:hypothetical protein